MIITNILKDIFEPISLFCLFCVGYVLLYAIGQLLKSKPPRKPDPLKDDHTYYSRPDK